MDVPIPRVLIDTEAPIQYKALSDHIEVRLVLLLPVDHPIFVEFDSAMSSDEEEFVNGNAIYDSGLVSIDTDLKRLGLDSEVCFYCRSCSVQLTKPIKSFTEMPSTNWSEVADNWFGGCCCSFGGISNKLVAKYANSYASTPGTCLLSTTFIVLYKDDLVGCNFPCGDGSKEGDIVEDVINAKSCEEGMLSIGVKHARVAHCFDTKQDAIDCNDSGETKVASNLECHRQGLNTNGENLCNMLTALELSHDVSSASGCCDGVHSLVHKTENGCFETSGTCLEDHPLIKTFELPENQKSFLNGFLGDIFMARSSNLSKDVLWVEYLCPQCSSFIGAYPAANGCKILDGGIRLFKCYISTCLPTGGSQDVFWKYTLERMFTNQLVENAKTELSYRTVIRDLQTESAMLQIVLLNPSSFIKTGYCSGTENNSQSVDKVDLSSAIKVLFADCSGDDVSQTRSVDEWVMKNQVDEVYMFAHQIKELIKTLQLAKDMFPLSCISLQGLLLSSLTR